MMNLNVGVAGYYRLQTMTEDGTITKDTGQFPNLITNQGMNWIDTLTGSGNNIFSVVSVGTGNTTPAFTDTTLVTYVAGKFGSNSGSLYVAASGTQPPYWTVTWTYTYGVGAAAGNLAEIGTGPSANSLASRALIVDNTGTPTVITVLPTEILIVTYEFRLYIDTSDQTGSYLISGVTYNTTWRPVNITSAPSIQFGLFYNGSSVTANVAESSTLVAVTGTIGSQVSATGGSIASYTPGSYVQDCTNTYDISTGNFATGIGMVVLTCNLGSWQVSHSPKIPKDGTKSLSLTYRFSWARFTPPP